MLEGVTGFCRGHIGKRRLTVAGATPVHRMLATLVPEPFHRNGWLWARQRAEIIVRGGGGPNGNEPSRCSLLAAPFEVIALATGRRAA